MKVLITTSKHIASFQLACFLKNDEVLFGDHFTDFPLASSNSLAHQILKFCLDNRITKIFPLAFAEVEELKKSLILFDEFGIEVMLGSDDLQYFNQIGKIANSFEELSAGLINLGYPSKKIAIADATGRGELILIDDAVKDNLQIWNAVKSVNFNQLGKWFNQSNFEPVALYQYDDLQTFFVLIYDGKLHTNNQLIEELSEVLENIVQKKKLKGLYHVAFANNKLLRIINANS